MRLKVKEKSLQVEREQNNLWRGNLHISIRLRDFVVAHVAIPYEPTRYVRTSSAKTIEGDPWVQARFLQVLRDGKAILSSVRY